MYNKDILNLLNNSFTYLIPFHLIQRQLTGTMKAQIIGWGMRKELESDELFFDGYFLPGFSGCPQQRKPHQMTQAIIIIKDDTSKEMWVLTHLTFANEEVFSEMHWDSWILCSLPWGINTLVTPRRPLAPRRWHRGGLVNWHGDKAQIAMIAESTNYKLDLADMWQGW